MKKLLFLSLMVVLSVQMLGNVTVKLSKNKVKINEPVTITLVSQNEKNLGYSLELSSTECQIVGEQHNMESEDVNGKESMSQKDSYTIVPKTEGEKDIKIKFNDGRVVPLKIVVVK